jgi:hypothetical protein
VSDEFTPDEMRVLKTFASYLLRGSTTPAATAPAAAPTNKPGGRVASPAELSGRFGDQTVKKDPKRWVGPSYEGAAFSKCPSDYLIALANFLDWQGEMDMKKPEPPRHHNGTFYYEYKFKDAGLARGWAARNAGKDMPPPSVAEPESGGPEPEDALYEEGRADDDIPIITRRIVPHKLERTPRWVR